MLHQHPRYIVKRRVQLRRPQAPIPLKAVWTEHRRFFSAMNRAKGYKKAIAIAFLALTVFNIVYAFSEPAHAFLFNDLTAMGRKAGDGIMSSSFGLITDLYGGQYGVLPWLSKTCLYFATPVAAAGIVQYLSEEVPDNPIKRPVILGTIFLVIALSGGGYIFGQLYLFLFNILEGFFQKMDDYLRIYDAIAQGKAFLASNAMISGSVAECSKFVGQEQQRCISEASTQALNVLKDYQETFNFPQWVKERVDIFKEVVYNIADINTSLNEKAANVFFMFAAPAAEIAQNSIATASITAFTAIYSCVMAYIGLGGPIAGLSSLLVPGLQSGWIVWLTSIFMLWFWRLSYMTMMWFLSKTLVNATAENIVGTAWFTLSATVLAPILATGIAGGGAFAVWSGLLGFAGAAVSTVTAGVVSSGLFSSNSPSESQSPSSNSSSPPQGSPTPYVRTDY